MGKIRIPVTIICLLLAFTAVAAKQTGMAPSLQPPLALEDGDRVVLLGNSLFENELRYGYLEYALTTRWADRDVSFRNLGWTGDTVFGEARGYFTNPPDAYGHLIDQLEKARPTMVILAYGTNEAYEGAKGLDRYIEGLNRLLDKIDELNARVVMLSPIPHFPVVARPEINTSHNENLTLYTKAQSGVADKRGVPFIDVFTTLRQNSRTGELTTNGMHLNERGYYYLAREMEKQLGLRERTWSVHIDAEKLQADRQGAVIWDLAADDAEPGVMTFKVLDATLPFPRPEGGAASGPAAGRTL
ncbi:MAG: SGNH/GDSL hydrolase family protein, partial [Balneolales bacterium]